MGKGDQQKFPPRIHTDDQEVHEKKLLCITSTGNANERTGFYFTPVRLDNIKQSKTTGTGRHGEKKQPSSSTGSTDLETIWTLFKN